MKKSNKKVLPYVSKCEEIFNKLTKEYIIKSKKKYNYLNKVSSKLLKELQFLKNFTNSSGENIKLISSINLREDFINIAISRIKDNKEIIEKEIFITIREIEEHQNNILFNMHIESHTAGSIVSEVFTMDKASEFLGVLLYEFLIENIPLNCLNTNSSISRLINDLKTA